MAQRLTTAIHPALSIKRTQVIASMFANQADWLVRNAAGVVHPAGFTALSAPDDLVLSATNAVAISPPRTEAIDAALDWLRTTGPADLLIWSAAQNGRADIHLLARGARDGFRPRWMWRDLDAPLPSPRTGADVDIAIATRRDRDALRVAHNVPYVTRAGIDRILDLAIAEATPRQTWLVMARQRRRFGEGSVGGVGILHLTRHGGETIGGLYNLGVDPGWQGKGIGTALTLEICRIARDYGASRVALNATPSGERIYRQLDFAVAGDGQTWFLPEAVQREGPALAAIVAAEAIARGETARLDPATAQWDSLPNGESPVRFAARFQQHETIGWLLDHNAAADIAPLWAMGFRDEAIRAARNRHWLDRHWGPEAATPLHHAVRLADQDLVRMLIAAGADLTLRDSQWHARPLDWANALGHPDLAAMILEAM